jgi:hypothetical protein
MTEGGTAEAHPERFRVSLFSLLLVGGVSRCGNEAHDLSGFNVPEHFREPEVRGQHDHGFLFCLIRLIGIHLFRFQIFSGVVGREASPPSELLGERSFAAEGRATLCARLIVRPMGRVDARLRADARELWDGTIGWDDHSR